MSWDAVSIEEVLKTAVVESFGLKPRLAFAPIPVTVTGRAVSPPLDESLELLGRDVTLDRVRVARESFWGHPARSGNLHSGADAPVRPRGYPWGMG